MFRRAGEQLGRLLALVYFDLLGPQTLVDDGLVPAALPWSQAGVDPAFFHVLSSDQDPLSVLRLDVSPHPEGGWSLVSLGTQSPRGLGYALENRIVHSQFFGSLLPQENLLRLAPFFQELKDLWFEASQSHQDDPSIMVWTSGPSDPDYFEPVYLARYFGYPLVESRDLTVRSGKVFLKTLGGLRRVDVLIRMVNDRSLDPLAGNPAGLGGVAGLLQAVRGRTVVVTNAPGTGILEHPGLLPLWPALCERLLGETWLLRPGTASLAPTDQGVTVSLFLAHTRSGWSLMPGGLVQGASGPPKDLWILSHGEVEPTSLLPSRERPAEISRAADLPSRVADDLYWLGRYVERAWNDLRYLEKAWDLGHRNLVKVGGSSLVADMLVDLGIVGEERLEWYPGRLAETLLEIQRISSQVLDRLSLETHRLLKEFGSFQLRGSEVPIPETLRRLGLRLAAFHGLTMENMTRTPGWIFLDLGRRLERSELLLDGVRSFFQHEKSEENLGLLLELFDSILTYRSRYRLSPQQAPVLDLLLLDETNPRSLAFQVLALQRHIDELPRGGVRAFRSVEERTILDLQTRVRLCDAQELDHEKLEEFLQSVQSSLDTLAQALHQKYLAKIEPSEVLQARQKRSST